MKDFAANVLLRIFDPFLDWVITSLTVNIALIAQMGFAENEDGSVRRTKGSGSILVVNHGREPIKISEIGLILKDKTNISLSLSIVDDKLPIIVPAKDNKTFLIKRELFQNLTPFGIDSIKKVYIEDSLLNTITAGVPKWQKQLITYSVYGPKGDSDAKNHIGNLLSGKHRRSRTRRDKSSNST